MKIVVLNECFLKEEHLKRLKSVGEVEIFTDTDSEEKAIDRVKDADIIIADPFIAPLNKKVIESAKNLKLINVSVIGAEVVDVETANQKGIKIANIPGFCTEGVAELAVALMFAVSRNIALADKKMRIQPFQLDAGKKEDLAFKGLELKGKTLGVIGLGKIGQRTAQLGNAIGMNVIAFNRSAKQVDNVELVSFEDLLGRSDIISLHTPELENLISTKQFELMKDGTIFINTGRGKLVDENGLYQALVSGKLRGAGLDVLASWDENNPLLKLENVIFTPHEGYLTDGSVENMANMVVENTEAFVKSKPQNIVN